MEPCSTIFELIARIRQERIPKESKQRTIEGTGPIPPLKQYRRVWIAALNGLANMIGRIQAGAVSAGKKAPERSQSGKSIKFITE